MLRAWPVRSRLTGLVTSASGAWKLRETPAKNISPVRAVLLSLRESRLNRDPRILNSLPRRTNRAPRLLSPPPRTDSLWPNWPPVCKERQIVINKLISNNRVDRSLHKIIRRAVQSVKHRPTPLPRALTPLLRALTRVARTPTTRVPLWLMMEAFRTALWGKLCPPRTLTVTRTMWLLLAGHTNAVLSLLVSIPLILQLPLDRVLTLTNCTLPLCFPWVVVVQVLVVTWLPRVHIRLTRGKWSSRALTPLLVPSRN